MTKLNQPGGPVLIDTDALPSKPVHGGGLRRVIAKTPQGTPLVVQIEIKKGRHMEPHVPDTAYRLMNVIKGTLYWGDGEVVNPAAETPVPQGSMLLVPPGEYHWQAARDEDVVMRVATLMIDALSEGIQAQVK